MRGFDKESGFKNYDPDDGVPTSVLAIFVAICFASAVFIAWVARTWQ